MAWADGPMDDAAPDSVDDLRARLAEAEETLRAIRSGEVDALVVATSEGDRVFTLHGADEPYRIMLEQMSEGAASLSTDRVLLYANRRLAEMLEVSLANLVGKPIERFVAAEDRPRLAKLFMSRDGEPRGSDEFTFLTPAGQRVEAKVSVTQLPQTTGPGWSIVATDITERVRLEEELERRVRERTAGLEAANKELESFSYSISHDLRGPLRAMDGFSKALLADYADRLDEEGRYYLERIRTAAVRMGNLIDEILQLSRLSRRRFQRVRVDMSALATEVVAEATDAKRCRGAVEIQDGLFAEADLELAHTVLQNLLGNAFKFTAKTDDPLIRCGAVDQDGVLVYYVADNGAGFDMAHAKGRLFRPFHRLHRESEFPGDGIGLATVVRSVHRHGGEVWAEGAVNRGATFYFSLAPGADPPASAATGEDVTPRWQPADEEQTR